MTDDPTRFIWTAPGGASRELQAAGIAATTCAAMFGYEPGIATFPNGAAVFLFPKGTPADVIETRMKDMAGKPVPDGCMLGLVFDDDKKMLFVLADQALPSAHVQEVIAIGNKALAGVGVHCIGQLRTIAVHRQTGAQIIPLSSDSETTETAPDAPFPTPIGSDSEGMN